MFQIDTIGSYCAFPFRPYDPADLTPEGHLAIREGFRRSAMRDGLGEEAAEEAASQFYAHWLGRDWASRQIPKGDHARAFYSVRAYARKSAWHGFTGERRQYRGKRVPRGSDGKPLRISVRKACAAELAMVARLRERNQPTPDSVAMAMERIGQTPAHSRKAYRIAKAIGAPGVRELVREACGFHDPAPASFVPPRPPMRGVPAMPGDGTAIRPCRQ